MRTHLIAGGLTALLFGLTAACGSSPSQRGGPDAGGSPDSDGGDGGEDGGDQTPADTHPVVVLLDGQKVKLTGGLSANIPVDVPSGVVSMSITIQGPGNESYTLGGWTDASGQVLVNEQRNANEMALCLQCDNRIAAAEGAFGAIAPNNPASRATAGRHVFTAYGYAQQGWTSVTPSDAEVTVSVHAKMGSELPVDGVLDVNLFFSGANGWTAASAPDDAAFQAMLGKVDDIFGQVGVRLGELTFNDVDARFQSIENVMGANSDLMELFSQSASNERAAVNLFFVDELRSPMGVILGIAGGIPGPMVHGTHRSGVVVVTNPPHGTGGKLEQVVAHEIGHFLGLFHTSEQDLSGWTGQPQVHDPLPDTPQNDTSYLMHNSGAGGRLSEWQGRVMRSNPWVRHPEGN